MTRSIDSVCPRDRPRPHTPPPPIQVRLDASSALALLCAYAVIRYIHTTPTPFGRAHLCGERAGDFSTCSDYEWAPRRVGFTRSSLSRGRFCGCLAPSQIHDSRRKIKKIREFLDGRMFWNYDILLGPERFILYIEAIEIFFLYFQVSIYLFSNLLYQNIALGYFALFLYLTKIHVLFVQYKKC